MGAVARASSTRAYAVSLCPCFFLATSTSLSIESFCACTQTYEFHGIGRRGLVNSIVADAAGVDEHMQHAVQVEPSSFDRGLDERRLTFRIDTQGNVLDVNATAPTSLFGF
eukprot:608873-Pelagomonas_calceolata.AAC.3